MTAEERMKHFQLGVLATPDFAVSTTKNIMKAIKTKPPFLVCATKVAKKSVQGRNGELYEVAEQMIQLDIDGELRWMRAENFVRY
jgi:hypothetical protein